MRILPAGSALMQAIRIQARDFGTIVPIQVVVTPANGARTSIDAQIDNAANNPATVSVNVPIQIDVLTDISVFTR